MRPSRAILLTCLLSSLVAGCGDSDDSSPADSSKPAKQVDVSASAEQQQRSHATHKQAGVKEYVYAVETCAVNNTDGSYRGCLDASNLDADEFDLDEVPGTATVKPGPDPLKSYIVSVSDEGVTFTEMHGADGSITKTCAPADTALCTDGRWG
jgi:hypothetical protein